MDDDVDMEDVEAKIEEAQAKIAANSLDYDAHMALLTNLRKNGDLDELALAREQASALFPLPPQQWLEWITDERESGASTERIVELFTKATNEIRSVDLWLEYIQWAVGVGSKFGKKVIEDAVSAIGLRVDKGALVWETYLDIEEAVLADLPEDETKKQRTVVENLYKRALRIPTVDLPSIWERYNTFCGGEVDKVALAAHEAANKQLLVLAPLELKLADTDDSLDAFLEYLEEELKTEDPSRIQSFYERILEKHSNCDQLWIQYGTWLDHNLKVHSVSASVYARAVRFCPWNCGLWQAALLASERAEEASAAIDAKWEAAKLNIQDPNDGRSLYRTYIYLLKRRADKQKTSYDLVVETFAKGAEELHEYFGIEWDPQAQYRRNQALFLFDKAKSVEKARKVWEDILASGGGRLAERWIEATNLERRYGDVERARKLLARAINSVSDHPHLIFEYIVQFEREEGTIEQLDLALEKVNAQALRREQMQPKKEKVETTKERKVGRLSSRDKNQEGEGRKRKSNEANELQEKPLSKKAKVEMKQESKAAPVFEPAAPKKLDSEGFVMPTLPAAGKRPDEKKKETLKEADMMDSNGEKKYTVFISNLDFKCGEDKIREALDGVVEVRLVGRMGMSKLHKGYGYVDLDSEAAMQRALAKDRSMIDGRPVYISENNPEKDRRSFFKYATGLEKTKLFVRNVHYDCTQQQLKEAFEQFGELVDVRIVTHKSGKSKGCAYVEFANEADASKALEAEIFLLERKLTIMLSNPPRKGEAAPPPPATPRISHSSRLDLVPRNVAAKKAPSVTASSAPSTSPKTKMSNDEFRNLFAKK